MGIRNFRFRIIFWCLMGIATACYFTLSPSSSSVLAQSDNQPPTVEPIPDQTCLPMDRLAIPLTIADPDGDDFSVEALIGSGSGVSIDTISEAQLEISCDFPTTVSITVIASDTAQNRTNVIFTITVMQPNVAPSMRAVDRQFCEPNTTISIALAIADANNDAVSVDVVSRNVDVATGEISTNDVVQITCKGRGLTNLVIGMDDGQGGYNEETVTVAVGQQNESNANTDEGQTNTVLYILVAAFLIAVTAGGYWISRQE